MSKIARGTVTITMTREAALQNGLLTCSCGHRPNNHFAHDAWPCAFCSCKKYDEVAVVGRLDRVPLKEKP